MFLDKLLLNNINQCVLHGNITQLFLEIWLGLIQKLAQGQDGSTNLFDHIYSQCGTSQHTLTLMLGIWSRKFEGLENVTQQMDLVLLEFELCLTLTKKTNSNVGTMNNILILHP